MPDVKITQLPVVTSVTGSDVLPVVAGNTTSQITVANLALATNVIAASGSSIYSTGLAGTYNVSPTRSVYLGPTAGANASASYDSNFIGNSAGFNALGANTSNFIGVRAGSNGSRAYRSNFIGAQAGFEAVDAYNANIIGYDAGVYAGSANNSNFMGTSAGYNAQQAYSSNFIGNLAGFQAYTASNSTFIGGSAGLYAGNAENSVFVGNAAGKYALNAAYSILIGAAAGVQNLFTQGASIGTNNIIIGNGITVPTNVANAINFGGLIFGTGSYDGYIGFGGQAYFSGSANGKVGINQPSPKYSLDVAGAGNYTNGLTTSGSLLMSGSIIPAVASGSATSSFSLGSATNAWKDIYVSNGTINFLDGAGTNQGTLSSTATGLQLGSSTVSGSLVVTGSIIVGYPGNTGKQVISAVGIVAGSQIAGSSGYAGVNPVNNLTSIIQPVMSGDFTSYYSTVTRAPYTYYMQDLGIGTTYSPYDPASFAPAPAIRIGHNTALSANTGSFGYIAAFSTIISSNANLSTLNTTADIAYSNGIDHVLAVTGSLLSRDNTTLGTVITNTTFIKGGLTLTGSLSMSLDTGTPSSAVTPAGFYKAAINGASVYIPYYI